MNRDSRNEAEVQIHPIWDNFPEFKPRLLEVAVCLSDVIEKSPALIKPDLEIVMNPGKMLRPAFVLMAATTGGTQSEHLVRVAAAIELLHTATLVHDDVIDLSSERRSRATLHTKVGMKRAILAGDYLFALALELASAAHNDLLVDVVNKAVSSICLSEIEQDSDPGNYFIDRDAYYRRIRGKTAELFALSCRIGAILGGADEEVSDGFYDAGLNFGLAFQIMDDVLDYRGSKNTMGKPAGNDLKDGIPTLPLILALEAGNEKLERMCRSRMKYSLCNRIRNQVIAGGYDEAAVAIGASHIVKCLDGIDRIDFSDRKLFKDLIDSLRLRDV